MAERKSIGLKLKPDMYERAKARADELNAPLATYLIALIDADTHQGGGMTMLEILEEAECQRDYEAAKRQARLKDRVSALEAEMKALKSALGVAG